MMVLLRVLLVILLQIRHPLWALVTIAFMLKPEIGAAFYPGWSRRTHATCGQRCRFLMSAFPCSLPGEKSGVGQKRRRAFVRFGLRQRSAKTGCRGRNKSRYAVALGNSPVSDRPCKGVIRKRLFLPSHQLALHITRAAQLSVPSIRWALNRSGPPWSRGA